MFLPLFVVYGLVLRIKTSELRTERGAEENRWQTDVPTAGIFWVFIGNNKTWYKKSFLGAAGVQHARPRPGLQDYSL